MQQSKINLWQRRYWEHQIRDESDLRSHVDYIHFNPVKHGHVKSVRECPIRHFIVMCNQDCLNGVGEAENFNTLFPRLDSTSLKNEIRDILHPEAFETRELT